jgi:hypothetical protein
LRQPSIGVCADSAIAEGFSVPDPLLSQHPVDVLIRRIIAGEREATEGDVGQIVERFATAPFNPDVVPVPRSMRGLTYFGDTLGGRAPSVLPGASCQASPGRAPVE